MTVQSDWLYYVNSWGKYRQSAAGFPIFCISRFKHDQFFLEATGDAIARLSLADAAVDFLVIPNDEERVIVEERLQLLSAVLKN